MAQLTPEQQTALEQWAADGATLNDVQRRLKDEFGVNLTYLDARLLLLDLQVKLKDKPKEKEPAPPEPQGVPTQANEDDQDMAAPAGDEFEDDVTGEPLPGGKIQVSVDQLAIPGAIISGRVVFSDGVTAGWYLDQMGRLGLRGTEPGYKPPAQDVPQFQAELDRVLMQAGF